MEEFEKRAKERAARDKELAEDDEARALGKLTTIPVVLSNYCLATLIPLTKPIIQAKKKKKC